MLNYIYNIIDNLIVINILYNCNYYLNIFLLKINK